MSDAEEECEYLLTPKGQRIFVSKLPESQILTSATCLTPTSQRITSLRQADIVKFKRQTIKSLDNVIF
jgi:hypothetical protein